MTKERKAEIIVISEIIFTIMPVIIMIFLKMYKLEYYEIITMPDWSFISIIFMGQTIIKLNVGLSTNKNKKNPGPIMLLTTMLIVIGLIPSIIILVLITLSKSTSIILIIIQLIYFIFSVFVYFNIGTISQILIENPSLIKEDIIDEKK